MSHKSFAWTVAAAVCCLFSGIYNLLTLPADSEWRSYCMFLSLAASAVLLVAAMALIEYFVRKSTQ